MTFSKIKSLTKKQTDHLNKNVKGKWKFDPKTGLVNIKGSYSIYNRGNKTLCGISFGYVTGNFNCSFNKLTSLEGAPQSVYGNFYCYSNKLTSLKDAPEKFADIDYSENPVAAMIEKELSEKGYFEHEGFLFSNA